MGKNYVFVDDLSPQDIEADVASQKLRLRRAAGTTPLAVADKVLVRQGNDLVEVPSSEFDELPPYTVADAGKKLAINDAGNALEWKNPPGNIIAIAGGIIQMVALNNADLPVTGSGTATCQFTYNFTPKSANSRLVIQADANIAVAGLRNDGWAVSVLYRGVLAGYKQNAWDTSAGQAARGAPLMPIQAVVDLNNAVTVGQIIVRLARQSGDGLGYIRDRNLTIMEIQL